MPYDNILVAPTVDAYAEQAGGNSTRPYKYLKTKEVSDLTGFSIKTLERWRHQRCGPPFVIVGRNVRYRSDLVVQWMERVQIKQVVSSKNMGGK